MIGFFLAFFTLKAYHFFFAFIYYIFFCSACIVNKTYLFKYRCVCVCVCRAIRLSSIFICIFSYSSFILFTINLYFLLLFIFPFHCFFITFKKSNLVFCSILLYKHARLIEVNPLLYIKNLRFFVIK